MMKTLLAIDPGLSGGLAWTNSDGLWAVPMPDGDAAIAKQLDDILYMNSVTAWLEEVPIFMPSGVPGSAITKLHSNARFIEGYLFSRCVVRRIKPHAWQKPLMLGTRSGCKSSSQWKTKLRDEAARRFPTVDVTLKTADALLILDFARNTNG